MKKYKRYRYRKITPEDIEKMTELRGGGLSYKEIGKRFNVDMSTALYHLSPREKEMSKKRAHKSLSKLTKKQIREKNRKKRPYIRQYIKERYQNDEEFRRGFLDIVKRSEMKRRRNWVKLGLCSTCGKERKDKGYRRCENCRRKKREYNFKKGNVKNPRK